MKSLLRIVITLVLLGAVVAGAFLFRPGSRDDASAGAAAPAASVVVELAAPRTFTRSLVVNGNLAPVRFAMVSARIPGHLDAILVD